jgi:hypothetical protein
MNSRHHWRIRADAMTLIILRNRLRNRAIFMRIAIYEDLKDWIVGTAVGSCQLTWIHGKS